MLFRQDTGGVRFFRTPPVRLREVFHFRLADAHILPAAGQPRPDQRKQMLRVAGGLDVVGAVHIHQVKAALRDAPELMDIRRGVVGEAAASFGHEKSPPALVWPEVTGFFPYYIINNLFLQPFLFVLPSLNDVIIMQV